MMKYVAALILLSQTLCAMEIEMQRFSPDNSSIAKNRLIPKLPKKSNINLSLLRMDQIDQLFSNLPSSCKDRVQKQMSPNTSFIFGVATLSKDIRNKIVTFIFPKNPIKAQMFFAMRLKEMCVFLMFKRDMRATATFFGLPRDEAVKRYDKIRNVLKSDNKPIGPLYIASQNDRDSVLKMLDKPWYYDRPIITIGDQKKIESMDGDILKSLAGKQVLVLPEDEKNLCTSRALARGACVTGGASALSLGIYCGVSAAFGACLGTPNCVCDPIFLTVSAKVWGCMIPSFYCWMASFSAAQTYKDSEKVTL